MTTHLSMENIELYITGRLDESKTSQFYAHLKVCDSCRHEYKECRKNLEAIGEIRKAIKIPFTAEQPADRNALSSEAESIDDYLLIREIHRGGQGVVYEALQQSTHRRVALKVLLGGPFAGENAKRRFEREVNLAANLRHPHIVTIYDSGIAHDRYYLTMDYIDGQPLDQYISTKSLSFRQKIHLFQKICDAVNFAHQRGVIHRDLKPSNILVTESGEPCVLDFGLARRMEDDYDHEMFSIDGQILGTPKYMAPEQADGKLSEIDARTDIYALGLIFYKILTEKLPYSVNGNIRQILLAIHESQPARPSSLVPRIDKDIEIIVLKALEKAPDRRYQSVGELMRDLELWQQGLPIVARSASSMYVLNKLISRHRFTAGVMGLLFTILFGALVICFDLYRTTEAARARSERTIEKLTDGLTDRDMSNRALFFLLFLNAWENDLAKDAREFALVIGNSLEGYGAWFLLNPYPLEEKEAELRRELGPSRNAFVEFVLGELHRKEGRWMEASERYRKSLSLSPQGIIDRWLKWWINGRMENVAFRLHKERIAKRP